jgi:hypothetical protein
MATDIDERQLQQIQNELRSAGLSRRGFIDGIKALGLGFGATAMLGVDGAKARTPDVNLTSTNPALGSIIDEGHKDAGMAEDGEPNPRTAYLRAFRRAFARVGYRRGFARVFRRF